MLPRLIFLVTYGYYWILLKTVRLKTVGLEAPLEELGAGKTPVFASAHNSLLTSTLSFDGRPATLLASLSKDGEIIARLLEKRGYDVVRGSSSRGSVAALSRLINATTKIQPIGITFDGPRGPALVPKKGVTACAHAATGSLYFVFARVIPFLGKPWAVRLKSWDRFLLPLPFCKLEVHYEKIESQFNKETNEWETEMLAKLESAARREYQHLYVGQ